MLSPSPLPLSGKHDEAEEKSDEDCEDDNKEEDEEEPGKDSCEKGDQESNGAHGEESEEEHAAENERMGVRGRYISGTVYSILELSETKYSYCSSAGG